MYQQSINRHFEMPKDFDIQDIQAGGQRDPKRSSELTINGGSLDDEKIQDVDVTSEKTNKVNRSEARICGIEGAQPDQQEDNGVLYGGSISWESLENYQKVKWRGYITVTTLALWIVLTIVSLIVYANTGNYTLLIFSPGAMMGVALYRVLFKLLRYYFGF